MLFLVGVAVLVGGTWLLSSHENHSNACEPTFARLPNLPGAHPGFQKEIRDLWLSTNVTDMDDGATDLEEEASKLGAKHPAFMDLWDAAQCLRRRAADVRAGKA